MATTGREPRRPVTPKGEATRRRLLEAAERLFGEKGFHNASIVEITREAGVGHGTFYLYFENKEDAFRQLVRHLSVELRRAIRRATDGLEDRIEIEKVGARTFFSFAQSHRDMYKIVRESEFVDEEVSVWYYRRMAKGYVAGLEAAMGAGQIPRWDPETLAYCLMGMSHMLGMRWIVWEGREPPEAAIETLLAFIESGLSPRPDAATSSSMATAAD